MASKQRVTIILIFRITIIIRIVYFVSHLEFKQVPALVIRIYAAMLVNLIKSIVLEKTKFLKVSFNDKNAVINKFKILDYIKVNEKNENKKYYTTYELPLPRNVESCILDKIARRHVFHEQFSGSTVHV